MNKQSDHGRLTPGRLRDERGSALILTLGVLALLLISATVFVFAANTEREAAAVNADMTKARLMAKSKMEQALALIYRASLNNQMSSYFTYGSDDWKGYYHMASTWNPAYNAGLADALTAFVGFDLLPRDPSAPGTIPPGGVGGTLNGLNCHLAGVPVTPAWQLITGIEPPSVDLNNDGTSGGSVVIGRAAYLVMMEPDIDPYATIALQEPYLDLNSNGSYDDPTTDYLYNWNPLVGGRDTASPGETIEKVKVGPFSSSRRGCIVSEIYAGHRFYVGDPSDADGNMSHATADLDAFREFIDKIQPHSGIETSPPAGQERWLDWRHIKGRTTLTDQQLQTHARGFAGNTRYSPQAYNEGGTNYQRFSLAGFDWDSYTPTDSDSDGEDDLIGTVNRVVWDGTNPTESIEWLGEMKADMDLDGDGTAGGASDHTILRNQVAANLIDYSDSDGIATHDYATNKTYCGLEKVPFLNEVGFELEYNFDSGTGEGELEIWAYVEVIGIFLTAPSFDPSGLELKVTVDGTDLPSPPMTIDFSPTGAPTPVPDYRVVTFAKRTIGSIVPSNPLFNCENVEIERIELIYRDSSGNVQDFGTITTSSGTVTLASGSKAYASSEALDARANTLDSQWTWDSLNTTTNLISGTGSLGAYDGGTGTYSGSANTYSDPRAPVLPPEITTIDSEIEDQIAFDASGGDPLSTAYIRNGPITSLWELGAIHRGEPFRTVNLKSAAVDAPDGRYGQGDAKLLSHCCITREKLQPGKINVNSANRHTWYAVLRGIKVGCDYYPNTSLKGSFLSRSDVIAGARTNDNNDPIDFILDANGSDDGSGAPFGGRWQIATVAALSDGTVFTQDTDRKQEELIGKTANLLTADLSQRFRIFVVVQVLRDIGNTAVPDEDNWIRYSASNRAELLAETKLMGLVDLDRKDNSLSVVKTIFVE